jgi:sec-independent protein translocase protein TatA
VDLGAPEILIILLIVILLFGARKVPELARSLGQAQREFKKGTKEGFAADDEPAPAAKATDTTASEAKPDPKNN